MRYCRRLQLYQARGEPLVPVRYIECELPKTKNILFMAYTAQGFPVCYSYLNSENPTRTQSTSMSFLHKTSCPWLVISEILFKAMAKCPQFRAWYFPPYEGQCNLKWFCVTFHKTRHPPIGHNVDYDESSVKYPIIIIFFVPHYERTWNFRI